MKLPSWFAKKARKVGSRLLEALLSPSGLMGCQRQLRTESMRFHWHEDGDVVESLVGHSSLLDPRHHHHEHKECVRLIAQHSMEESRRMLMKEMEEDEEKEEEEEEKAMLSVQSGSSDAVMREGVPAMRYSYDPCQDFHQSMAEMLMRNGVESISRRDLDHILLLYLLLNPLPNHGFIHKAYQQLLYDPQFAPLFR